MDSPRRPIMFVTLPESGLMNSLRVLAGELARRGVQDIWFATDEHRRGDVEALADKSKVEFWSLGEVEPRLSALTWSDEVYRAVTQPSRFKSHKAIIKHSYDPSAHLPKYERLSAAVDEVKPALMVIDTTAAFGVDVAVTKNIPYVLSAPYLPSNLVSTYMPFGKSYTSPDFPVPHSGLPLKMTPLQRLENRLFRWRTLGIFLDPRMARMMAEDSRKRKELGIAWQARKPMGAVELAEMVLCYSVAEMDYPFTPPSNMRLVGAVVPPLPEAPEDVEMSRWLSEQDSVVYMAFGTNTRLTKPQVDDLLEVARRLEGEHQFLWKLPTEQQHLLPTDGSVPANVRVENWIPSQYDALAHPSVKAMFTHAGGNSFHESLYFGKPLVSRPLWIDCHDQALRGQDFGVSLTLDRPAGFDPDDVVDKLTRVLTESSFRERAEHYRDLLRAAGGRERAADLLVGLVSGRE
ncbi:glycosyltransferase [Umezawaea endophytica]|uniref:Glycosyltransferase n=1 Tax=Umezawaea endophytica TaxID=1654476 RepID=A0A9X2VUX9_9PSEU|nr:glycosyltransferase [Umezawaea endophytica]MCS7483116.1 glycosyltransferase [Umezawaea endophytica]